MGSNYLGDCNACLSLGFCKRRLVRESNRDQKMHNIGKARTVSESESVRDIMNEHGFQYCLDSINRAIGLAISDGVTAAAIESALIHAAVTLRTCGKQKLSDDEISKIGQFLAFHCCLFTKHVAGGSRDYPIIDQIIAATHVRLD